MMMWSRSSIPMILPTSASRVVSARSSADGSTSPEGWLWTTTILAVPLTMANLKELSGAHERGLQGAKAHELDMPDRMLRVEAGEPDVLLVLIVRRFRCENERMVLL